MATLRAWSWAAIWIVASASFAKAQSNTDTLKLIPASADGFAIISKIGELDKKAATLAQKLNLPAPGLFELGKQMAGLDEGIDRNGSAVAVMFLPPGEEPAFVVAVPVSNFEAVLKSVNAKDANDGIHDCQIAGTDSLIAKKGNYALIAQVDCRQHLARTIKGEPGILDKVKSIGRWLASQDASAVVLESAVKEFAKKIHDVLPDDLPPGVPVPPKQAEQIKIQLELMKKFVKISSEELTHFAVGMTTDSDSNTKLSLHVGYSKGGTFSKWGGAQPKESPLTGLPAAAYIVAFGSTLSPESMQSLMGFSATANKETFNLTDEQAKELEKIWTSAAKGLRGMSIGFQPTANAGGTLFDGVVGVMRVDNSREFMKSYRETMEKATKIMNIDTKVKTFKIGKFDGFEAAFDLKAMLKGNNDPLTEKMLDKFFGAAEKMTISLVAVNNNTVLFGYVPAAKMKGISEGYAKLPMLTSAPMVAKTMRLFPENSFSVTVVNPKGVVDFAAKFAKEMGHELPLPALGDTPPIGFAVASDATSFQFVVAAPGDVLAEIGKMVQSLKNR